MSSREAVVAEVQTWLRTPYHHLARVKRAGVDCAQILIAVYGSCGLLTPAAVHELEQLHYSPQWSVHRSEELYLRWLDRYAVQTPAPAAGDVAIWRFGRTFSHAGILIDPTQVVHALQQVRQVTITALDEAPLAGREVKFYTLF